MIRRVAILAVAVLPAAATVLVTTGLAEATQSPEARCQQGRYKAAAKYASCVQKTLAQYLGGVSGDLPGVTLSKCRVKYVATWDKLVAKGAGSTTCVGDRFVAAGDGTVTDRLTSLQWEQKTDDATLHDKDNLSTWSAGGSGSTAADGTAFTSFLAPLNSGGCFAGQCDWRLPTMAELQTILAGPYPCTTFFPSPCIDQGKFGPTADYYWSSTTYTNSADEAWLVYFDNGVIYSNAHKNGTGYVRAVRGGL